MLLRGFRALFKNAALKYRKMLAVSLLLLPRPGSHRSPPILCFSVLHECNNNPNAHRSAGLTRVVPVTNHSGHSKLLHEHFYPKDGQKKEEGRIE